MQTGVATVENSMEFPSTIKNRVAILTQHFHFLEYIQRNLKH